MPPKITITHSDETPTSSIVKKAGERVVVTDTKNRRLSLKKLSPLDRMRMSEAAGAANAVNQPYMLYVLVACSLVAVDDDELIIPTNKLQLEAAIKLLGDEGYDAALDAVLGMYGSKQSEEIVETAKK